MLPFIFDAETVIACLDAKNAKKPCARCDGVEFQVVEEGLAYHRIQPIALEDSGQIITIVIVCNNCGALTFHEVQTLGLKINSNFK